MQPFYDRFFIRLFNNLFENEQQFQMQCKELGVDFSFEAYTVCYCELPELSAQGMGQEKLMSLYSSTTHMAWETVTRFMACYITPLDTRHFNVTFCLSEQESPVYREVVRDVLEKVVQVVYNYFSVRLVCCVGCRVTRPMDLSESYYTARLCLTDRNPAGGLVTFFDGENRTVDAENVFDIALYRKPLIRAFEEQDAGELEQIMNRVIDSIRAHPARRLQAMDAACNLLFLCLSQFSDGEEIVSHIFDQEPEGYRCIYRQRGIPEITGWMCTLRDGLLKALREQKRGYKNQIIVQIKAYIQANLNQRLNLQNVAAVFGFSPSYLSTLFAKQAECPFVEYVTREKIRAAKEMMREGNVKLYEIAERLGFDNAFYWAMMEYLLGGEHPIFTHIKMEMGNDGNNSTGPDACTMRYADEEADVSRSPGFVMAADAKKINPDVKVSFLRWGSPKWVSDAGFYNNTEEGYEAMYTWYRETIFDAYEKYGYVVDMVNPDTNETGNPNDKFIKWYANRVANETEFPAYFDQAAIDAYHNIRIIASDENKGLNIVPHMRKDADLYNAVDIIGFHYRSSATGDYITMADVDDKEVWYSEGCATFGYSEFQENKNIAYGADTIGGFQGPLALMDHFITSFEGSRRTHYIFQPAVGGFYEGIQYGHKELLSARDPWSGYIHYDPALYMLEHFTAFANMGWENEDNTAGIWRAIPGASKGGYAPSSNEHATAGQDGRAGYLTLVSPDKKDFSVVFVNNTRNEKVFTIKAQDLGVAEGQQLAVWTTETDSYLQKTGTVDCVDGAWIVKLPAYSIVTATTLTEVEPERAPVDGVHNKDRTVLDTDSTGRNNNVTDDDYLYADDFDYAEEPDMEQYNVLTGETNVSYLEARGNEPRYFLDTHGAWVVENGKLKQELPQSVSQWNNGDPATIVGDFRWMDYSASAEISFPEGAENGRWGGIGIRCQSGMNWNNSGYTLHIQRDGWWNLYRGGTKITSGNVDAKSSYTLTLMGLGDTITAIVDGDVVAVYTDPNPMLSGRVKFSCGWKQVYFDNFEVKTVKGGIPYALAMIDNQDDSVSYTGSWDIGHSKPAGSSDNGWGSADDWYRTLSKSKAAGASFSFPFTGTGFALIGSTGSGVKLKVTVDGKLVGEGVSTVDVPKRYESYVLSGLENGNHRAKVEVVSGSLTLDAIHFLGERLEADQDAVVSVKSVTVDTATSLNQLRSILPETVTVTTVGGKTRELPVQWDLPTEQELLSNAFKGMTLTGAVKDAVNPAGMAVTASASVTTVVPAGTVYYIDMVTNLRDTNAPETTEPYEAVKKVMGENLLNDKYDQLKTDENTWGLVDRDAGTKSYTGTADPTATGIYGKDNKSGETLTYALTLEAGDYILYSAHREWWGMDRPMKAAIKVGGTTVDGGVISLSKSSGDQFKQISFTVPEGGAVVEYTVTATGTQAPVISWLAVVKTNTAEQPCEHAAGTAVRENEVKATCKTEGSCDEVVYCTLCGKELSRESKTIEKLGHTEVIDAAVEATCTEAGKTEGKHCSVCGEVIKAQETIPAKGHNYGATWTWTGDNGSVSVVLTCGTCGNKVDNLTAEVTSETTPATATQTGKTVYTATVTHDGRTYTDTHEVTIPATGGSSTGGSVRTCTLTVSYVFEDGTQAANAVQRTLSSGSRYNIASPAIEGYTPSQTSVTGALRANVSVTVTYVKDQEIEEPDIPLTDVSVTEIFADVKDTWYTDAVAYVYTKGLMSGTAAGRFSPEDTTTRAMMAAIIYRMESEPEAPLASFSDVLSGAWYAPAVSWAQKNGVIQGYGDGTFGPDKQITREQMVTIIYRYAQLKGYDTTGRADLSGYADAGELGDWAEEAMSWAVSVGLIQGTGATTLSPKGSATRAQIALITMRMDQLFRGEAIA